MVRNHVVSDGTVETSLRVGSTAINCHLFNYITFVNDTEYWRFLSPQFGDVTNTTYSVQSEK
jgi:hypothetical protein